MTNSVNKPTEQKIKTKTTLDEQIKVAHEVLWAVCAFLIFVALGPIISKIARQPQVPPAPERERISAEYPFGYPRISQTFTPTSCQNEACYQLDNFDLLDFDHNRMTNSQSYQQIRERNREIIYLLYDQPHAISITAYDAGQTYVIDMGDFYENIWVQDDVDWYYFRDGEGVRTTLRTNIPATGDNFNISVDYCGDFIFGIPPENHTYIKVWDDSSPSTPTKRGNYEMIKVEDAYGDCANKRSPAVLKVIQNGRGAGPSDSHSHAIGENVWNYLAARQWPGSLRLNFNDNRPEWTVSNNIENWEYCGMEVGEKCEVTDWRPIYAYSHLFDEDRNGDGFHDFFFNGMYWDVFSYGAHNEGTNTQNVDFEALDELQQNFREASGEIYSGDELQQIGNDPTDFEDSGMTGGMILQSDLSSDPFEQTRNMILEVINRAERWQGEYTENLPLTLEYCCSRNFDLQRYRFNFIIANILGSFSGNDVAYYQHWLDEYAVDSDGKAFINNQAEWDNPDFNLRDYENYDAVRHYLGYPEPTNPDKELLTEDLPVDNEVPNGSFEENGTAGWETLTQNGAEVTLTAVPCAGGCPDGQNALRVDITDPNGRDAPDIKVYRDDLDLSPGTVYTVEYWLIAENPRLFDFALFEGGTVDFILWDSYVGTEWKRFVYTFKAEEDDNKIEFRLGRDGRGVGSPYQAYILIDNIKIQQGDGFIGYQREFENGIMLLNPAPSEEGASDVFKVLEGEYKKILGCTGDAHCDRTHNSGEVIDSANGYTCSGGLCDLTINALDGYVLLKTGVNAGLDIELSGAPSVPQGEIYTLTTQVQNNTQDIQTVDISYNLTFPSGADRDDPTGPYNGVDIDPYQTWQRNDQFEVDTPVGTYTFSATLRDHENQTILDTATLNVEVSEPEDPYFRQEREPEFRIIGSTTYLWREAERASLTPPMERAKDPNASDGAYILVPNGAGDNGMAQYTISIPEEDKYIIWGRIIAPSSEDDSFWVQMDEGTRNLWNLPKTTTWAWDKVSNQNGSDPTIFPLTQGTHTLYIRQREDGAKLDELLITNDLDYIPPEEKP